MTAEINSTQRQIKVRDKLNTIDMRRIILNLRQVELPYNVETARGRN